MNISCPSAFILLCVRLSTRTTHNNNINIQVWNTQLPAIDYLLSIKCCVLFSLDFIYFNIFFKF